MTAHGERKAAAILLWVLVAMVALVITAVIGYGVGYDAGNGSVDCTEGTVLALTVTNADELGNGKRVIEIGDCDRIETEALVAALAALTPPGSTTTEPATTAPPDSTTPPSSAPSSTPPGDD